jgi:hypothetical protein
MYVLFLFNRTTLQVFVTYLTGALYLHPLWFYKHQHDNRVRSKLFVVCQRWWFQWRFATILVNCASSAEMHNYCTPHVIIENFENFLIHRCNNILLSQAYCVWQIFKSPTFISNNPVRRSVYNAELETNLEWWIGENMLWAFVAYLRYCMCAWKDIENTGETTIQNTSRDMNPLYSK